MRTSPPQPFALALLIYLGDASIASESQAHNTARQNSSPTKANIIHVPHYDEGLSY